MLLSKEVRKPNRLNKIYIYIQYISNIIYINYTYNLVHSTLQLYNILRKAVILIYFYCKASSCCSKVNNSIR